MTERTPIMYQQITPIPVRPWTLNGLSERLINRIPDEVRSMLEEHFGSVAAGGARAMQPASGKGGRS